MAYDQFLGDRIHRIRSELNAPFFEKKMMGGLIFMVNNKMCRGIHIDKKYGASIFMAKIGEEKYQFEIKKTSTLPMDFTGRPMNGFFITPEGFDTDESLEYWIKQALDFNSTILK